MQREAGTKFDSLRSAFHYHIYLSISVFGVDDGVNLYKD